MFRKVCLSFSHGLGPLLVSQDEYPVELVLCRERLRPHGHRLDALLERFGLKDVLCVVVVARLSLGELAAPVIVDACRLKGGAARFCLGTNVTASSSWMLHEQSDLATKKMNVPRKNRGHSGKRKK